MARKARIPGEWVNIAELRIRAENEVLNFALRYITLKISH